MQDSKTVCPEDNYLILICSKPYARLDHLSTCYSFIKGGAHGVMGWKFITF